STRTPSSCISIIVVLALYEGLATERNLAGGNEMGQERVRIGLERSRIGDLEDVGEVAVPLLEIEAVADHERVRAIEPHVARTERHDPADRPIQQRTELERGRATGPQDRQEIRKG